MDNASIQKKSFTTAGEMKIWDKRHRMIYREVERIIKKKKYEKFNMVDYAACGGEVLIEAKKAYSGAFCFGVDIIESSIKTLKTHGISGKIHDLENLLDLDRKYDIALAGEVIEHLVSPDNFLYSINKNMTDGGTLILTFPNSVHMTGARYRSFHIREYTYRLTKSLLEAHGFKVVKRMGTEIPYLPDWTSVITRPFPRLGRCIIVIAEKVAPPNEELIKNTEAISDIMRLLRFLKTNKQWK